MECFTLLTREVDAMMPACFLEFQGKLWDLKSGSHLHCDLKHARDLDLENGWSLLSIRRYSGLRKQDHLSWETLFGCYILSYVILLAYACMLVGITSLDRSQQLSLSSQLRCSGRGTLHWWDVRSDLKAYTSHACLQCPFLVVLTCSPSSWFLSFVASPF